MQKITADNRSKTLGKRSGEDKVERVKCTRWVMEGAKFAFKLKLHFRGGIYMQAGLAIWKPSTSGDTNSCNTEEGLSYILSWIGLEVRVAKHGRYIRDAAKSLFLFLLHVKKKKRFLKRLSLSETLCWLSVWRRPINCQKPLYQEPAGPTITSSGR